MVQEAIIIKLYVKVVTLKIDVQHPNGISKFFLENHS